MSSTNTDKVYILLKDYESPYGKCHAGVSYTAKEWISRWFHKLTIEDFDIKTDWFELKQPVEDNRIEVKTFAPFKIEDDGIYGLILKGRKKIPPEKYEAVKKVIEREINGDEYFVPFNFKDGSCVLPKEFSEHPQCKKETPTPEGQEIKNESKRFYSPHNDLDAYSHMDIVTPTLERQDTGETIIAKESAQKDWEILSFNKNEYYFIKSADGLFRCSDFNEEDDAWTEERLLNHETKTYPIHSVRRLSDGEVFTVGDMVNCDNCPPSFSKQTIEKFQISNSGVMIASCAGVATSINNISKLLQTEQPKKQQDDKCIFDKDKIKEQADRVIFAKEAFEAARLTHPIAGFKFDTFEDYLQKYTEGWLTNFYRGFFKQL